MRNEDELFLTEAIKVSKSLFPDSERKNRSMDVLRRAVDEKRLLYKPSPLNLLGIQLQYISPGFWALQGGLLLAVLLLLWRTSSTHGELADYLWWGSVSAAWMGMLVCGDLGRHLSRGMAELEQSCYFNLPQMWTVKMILTGGADILILGFCCGGIAYNTDTPIWQVSVYLLVPFVLSNLCCLLLLTILRGKRGHGTQLALAIVTAMAASGPSLAVWSYTWNFLWTWVMVLAVGSALLVRQLRQCYKKISRGEILCWN